MPLEHEVFEIDTSYRSDDEVGILSPANHSTLGLAFTIAGTSTTDSVSISGSYTKGSGGTAHINNAGNPYEATVDGSGLWSCAISVPEAGHSGTINVNGGNAAGSVMGLVFAATPPIRGGMMNLTSTHRDIVLRLDFPGLNNNDKAVMTMVYHPNRRRRVVGNPSRVDVKPNQEHVWRLTPSPGLYIFLVQLVNAGASAAFPVHVKV